MSNTTPTEAEEQAIFIEWCTAKGYRFTAIPNSTYTTSWKQKRHNYDMGLRAGFPDLVVIAKGVLFAIEMKRAKGGVVSKEQKEWIDALQSAGINAKVCRGAAEAVEFVRSLTD